MNTLLATAYGQGDMSGHFDRLKSSVLVSVNSVERQNKTDDEVFNKILELTRE